MEGDFVIMKETNGYLMTALELRDHINTLVTRYNIMLMYGDNANLPKEAQLPVCEIKWEYME